jgi:hypothetical protein
MKILQAHPPPNAHEFERGSSQWFSTGITLALWEGRRLGKPV